MSILTVYTHVFLLLRNVSIFKNMPTIYYFQDDKSLEITKPVDSPQSNKKETFNFDFDHVFNHQAGQDSVFEEVSQLVQSAIDGYNVCIFAYGQTGSGKTFTMEGDETGKHVGIIPRTIEKIFQETSSLVEKGWKYKMEASFLGN